MSKFIEKYNFVTNTIILLILIFGAVGFHFPNEILPGQFANGNYSFNGSLGIGTSSPNSKLTINDSNVNNSQIEIIGNNNYGGEIAITGALGINSTVSQQVSPPNAEGMFICTGFINSQRTFTDLLIIAPYSLNILVIQQLKKLLKVHHLQEFMLNLQLLVIYK